MKTLKLLLDSHRMLVRLIDSEPEDYTLAERKAAYGACVDVQREVAILIKVSENAIKET